MKINLHTHSNCSLDGVFEPDELIKKLKDTGHDIVSITDHNTCEAYKKISLNQEIKVITGLEADAIINNHTYDFVCYGFNLDNVLNYAKEKYQTVAKRQQKIFNKLVELCNEKGIELTEVNTYDSSKEYAHFGIYRMLNEMFLNKYNITRPGDLYRLGTIDKDFPLYIDMHLVWPDLKELQEVIHQNKGKVFLAHPFHYHLHVEDVLNDVKDYVDGIEICNNPKSKEEVAYLYKFAKENNLLVSCGTDYHGHENNTLECEYLTKEMIQDIVSWIDEENL